MSTVSYSREALEADGELAKRAIGLYCSQSIFDDQALSALLGSLLGILMTQVGGPKTLELVREIVDGIERNRQQATDAFRRGDKTINIEYPEGKA